MRMAQFHANVDYQSPHINDDESAKIIVVCVLCLTAAYVAVLLRFCSRKINRAGLERDDWTIVLSLVLTTAFVAAVLLNVHFGLGRHQSFIRDYASFAKTLFASEILYNPAITATKLSILFLYGRVFTYRPFKITLWCVGIFILCYNFAAIMVLLFQCRPLRAAWDPSLKIQCIELRVTFNILSAINISTDFLVLGLPMTVLWRLEMPKSRKFQVSGLFLLGGFVCAVSIVRVIFVNRGSREDESWTTKDAAMWSVVETCIAIVSACLPVLRPVYNRVFHNNANDDAKNISGSYSKRSARSRSIKLPNLRTTEDW